MFGRLLRGGLATTVLVGALSFGMVAQAHAVVQVAPVAPVVVGAVEAAAPAAISATAACVASVVCLGAVGVAAVAVGLYATHDTWAPALGRYFGEEGPYVAPSSGTIAGGVTLGNLAVGGTAGVTTVTYTEYSTGQYNVKWIQEATCKDAGGSYTWTSSQQGGLTNLGTNTYTKSYTCPAGMTLAGFKTSNNVTGALQPANHIGWGQAGGLPDSMSTYRATSKCVKPDGTIQDLVIDYTGTGAAGYLIPSCQAAGIGNHAKAVDVAVKLPGRTDFRNVWTVTPPNDATYPDCDPTMSTGCTLSVWVDGAECLVGDARCLDWATASNSRVQCRWGPYTVSRARCDMLERAYRPGGVRLADPDIDGDPTTSTTTTTVPGPTTSAVPFPTEVPIPTAVPSPIPTPPVGDPGPTADSGQGCYPTGMAAWNPVEWVLRPVSCALVWAFVPPAGLETQLEGFGSAWDGSPAGTWVSTISDPVSDVVAAWSGGGSGCGGPEWTMNLGSIGGGSYNFRPFDSCREPLASVAPVVKGVGVALVFVIGFRAAANPVLGALGLPRIPGRRQLWQHEIHGE